MCQPVSVTWPQTHEPGSGLLPPLLSAQAPLILSLFPPCSGPPGPTDSTDKRVFLQHLLEMVPPAGELTESLGIPPQPSPTPPHDECQMPHLRPGRRHPLLMRNGIFWTGVPIDESQAGSSCPLGAKGWNVDWNPHCLWANCPRFCCPLTPLPLVPLSFKKGPR